MAWDTGSPGSPDAPYTYAYNRSTTYANANACGGSGRDRVGIHADCGRRGRLWAIRSRTVRVVRCASRLWFIFHIFWAELLLTGARHKCHGPVGCDAIRRAAVSFFSCLWACAVVLVLSLSNLPSSGFCYGKIGYMASKDHNLHKIPSKVYVLVK